MELLKEVPSCQVLVMKEGRVAVAGSFQSLSTAVNDFSEFMGKPEEAETGQMTKYVV